MKTWKIRVWWSLFHFFHVICKISNFNMRSPKHLTQASCTELTLLVALWNSTNKDYVVYSILKKNTVINKGHLNSEHELIFVPFFRKKKSMNWPCSSTDNLGSLFGECIEHEITLRILSKLYQICIDDSA